MRVHESISCRVIIFAALRRTPKEMGRNFVRRKNKLAEARFGLVSKALEACSIIFFEVKL